MEFEGMNKHDYLARLKEPSTYAGFAALLYVFGVNIAPAEMTAIATFGSMLSAAVAMFLPERVKSGKGGKKAGQ